MLVAFNKILDTVFTTNVCIYGMDCLSNIIELIISSQFHRYTCYQNSNKEFCCVQPI